MSTSPIVEPIAALDSLGNVVPEGYLYSEKRVTPGSDLSLPHAYFKWYDIYPPDVEITPEQVEESRTFVAAEAERLQFADELGFVLLHRAGGVLLLLVTTWRNTNEIWESGLCEGSFAEGRLHVDGV